MTPFSKLGKSTIAAWAAALLLASLPFGGAHGQAALTKVTFGTDWLAEAEHGGFYQALAAGIYKKHGLDVTIRQGGPNLNILQNVAAGVVDFQMTQEPFFLFSNVKENIPVEALGAFFQKSARVLMTHPGQGNDTLEQLKGKPVLISASARNGFWLWLKGKYGYTDDQIRPYNFNSAPFLADKKAAQQGLLTSEPYSVEKEGGFKPHVLLLADFGYQDYNNLVIAQSKLVRERPQVVQAFIDASIEGWYSYLYGDPKPGNELILKENKDMTPDLIASAIALTKQYGLADSGDTLTLGIGAMTEAKWQAIFDSAASTGLFPANLEWKKAFTTAFVNKKHGIDLKK
ncbi:MAG: ABC transporter substrate-binding protein [Proteobacteria bacterium]|nr:ABC transporter substrate-binding protein [Pseudomonadota bacterium]